MSSAKINGIDLHYQVHGEGDPIVFAHGAGGNLLSWWQQVAFFSRYFMCVTFDHRGFGRSIDLADGPLYAAFVDDLAGLMDHLDIDSAHLVAQSMGGRCALGLAAAYPRRVKSLVMADTHGWPQDAELEGMTTRWTEGRPARDPAVRALAGGFQIRRPDLAMLYLQISGTNPPRADAAGVTRADGPAPAKLAAMNVPTLFIVGEEDDIIPPHVIEKAATFVQGSRVIRVPEAGHSVYFEKPEVFNFEVHRFIQGCG